MRKNQVVAATITAAATILAAVLSVMYVNQPKQGASIANQNSSPKTSVAPNGRVVDDPTKREGKKMDLPTTSGEWKYNEKTIDIAGKIFYDYGDITSSWSGGNLRNLATFDISGYDSFEGDAGVALAVSSDDNSNTLIIKVNGDVKQEITTALGQPPQHFRIELTGAQSLTFARREVYPHIVIGKPRLFKGR